MDKRVNMTMMMLKEGTTTGTAALKDICGTL